MKVGCLFSFMTSFNNARYDQGKIARRSGYRPLRPSRHLLSTTRSFPNFSILIIVQSQLGVRPPPRVYSAPNLMKRWWRRWFSLGTGHGSDNRAGRWFSVLGPGRSIVTVTRASLTFFPPVLVVLAVASVFPLNPFLIRRRRPSCLWTLLSIQRLKPGIPRFRESQRVPRLTSKFKWW